MEKEFIPYEQALDLKELGFDEDCIKYYWTDGMFTKTYESPFNHNKRDNSISAPLYQQAFRFFREKYGLSAWVTSKTVESNTIYIPCGRTIPDTTKKELVVDVIPYAAFKTYEEAELECLKKLIEIVKKK